MPPTRFPRLGVEPIEDRLVPSPVAHPRPPAWGPALVSHDSHDFGRRFDPPRGPDAGGGERFESHATPAEGRGGPSRHAPVTLDAGWRDDVIVVVFAAPARGSRAAEARPAQAQSRAAVDPPPAAEPPSADRASPAAAARRAAPVSVAVGDLTEGTTSPPGVPAAVARQAVIESAAPAPVPVPPAEAGRAGPVFLGVPGDAADPPPGSPADPPTPGGAVPEPPAVPPLVERVAEALLPAALPLAGALPFDPAAVEAAAGAVATRLHDLGRDAADGWTSPERWAGVAAAVLVVGGVTYAVRVHRGRRRAEYVVLGTESALARWEGRNAGRTA